MSSNLKYTSSNLQENFIPFNGFQSYGFPYPPSSSTRVPRRRKRPSHRTRERKPLSRYDDYSDSISIALDPQFRLPSHPSYPNSTKINSTSVKTSETPFRNSEKPSPLLRQSFNTSWLRWKERELAQEKLEKEIAWREMESRLRLFGADGGDDGSLCGGMLGVVMSLFEGGLDFDYLEEGCGSIDGVCGVKEVI